MTAVELSERLRGRRSGSGWSAPCPAHEDAHASLSISEGDDGRVLVRCHAGCDFSAVLLASGLSAKDLAPVNVHIPFSKRRIVAEYSYQDASGAEVFQAIRFEPKDFRQRHRDETGKWVWNLRGVQRVLFRLPEVLATAASGGRIIVVEGEKDALNLAVLGHCATTSPMGAGKWLPEFSQSLKGASEVVVLPDRDEPGAKHARLVLASCRVAGVPCRVVNLPGTAKDVSDWLVTPGGSPDELRRLLEAPPLRVADPTVDAPSRHKPLRDLGKNLNSACRILRDEVARGLALWPGELGLNRLTRMLELGGKPIEDHHVHLLRERVADQYCLPGGGTPLRLPAAEVQAALEVVGHENEFHPVARWLESLPAASGAIAEVAGAVLGLESEFAARVLRAWAIGAAGRALSPGIKFDGVLILVGRGGAGKSTFFREVTGGSLGWFSDSSAQLGTPRAHMAAQTCWIWEWAELLTLRREKDVNEAKAFVTSQVDTYTPLHGRFQRRDPRPSVIVGTSQDDDFLKDDTGNRRWWTLRVQDDIDIEALKRLRAQFWGEAVAAFRNGERNYLSPDDEKKLEEVQHEFRELSPVLENVRDHLASVCLHCEKFTRIEHLADVLGFKPAEGAYRGKLLEIGSALRELGFRKGSTMLDGRRSRVWVCAGAYPALCATT